MGLGVTSPSRGCKQPAERGVTKTILTTKERERFLACMSLRKFCRWIWHLRSHGSL